MTLSLSLFTFAALVTRDFAALLPEGFAALLSVLFASLVIAETSGGVACFNGWPPSTLESDDFEKCAAQEIVVSPVNSKAGSYPAIEFSAALALKSAPQNLRAQEFVCNYFPREGEHETNYFVLS